MKTILFTLLLIIPGFVFSQSAEKTKTGNVRKDRPFGIAATVGGGNLLGVSLDYFVIPQLDIEVGFGISQYLSLKYHFAGGTDIRWSPYAGIGYGIPVASIREASDHYDNGVWAIPLGVKLINRCGFSFSVEAIVCFVYYEETNFTYYNATPVYSTAVRTEAFPSAGISFGYHF